MLYDSVLVAKKDMRIERRARTFLTQLLPFAFVSIVLFGIAFDANRTLLKQLAPGLSWLIVLYASVLTSQRSFSIEEDDHAADLLLLSPLDPGGIFLGKMFNVLAQLTALIVAIAIGSAFLLGSELTDFGLVLASGILGAVGLSAVAVIYGAIASGVRGAERVIPLLILPVATPILLAASRAWEVGLGVTAGSGWGALPFLGSFAAVFVCIGVVSFSWILES